MDDTKPQRNPTENNIIKIVLYSLAIASALGFTELVNAIFSKINFKGSNEIISKLIYVIFIFGLTLIVAYYAKTSVPL